MQDAGPGSREPINLQESMERIAPVLGTLPKGTHVAFIQEGDELYLYNISKALELFAGRPATASDEYGSRPDGQPAEPQLAVRPCFQVRHALRVGQENFRVNRFINGR